MLHPQPSHLSLVTHPCQTVQQGTLSKAQKIGTPSVHVGSLKLRLYIAKHCHHAKHAG